MVGIELAPNQTIEMHDMSSKDNVDLLVKKRREEAQALKKEQQILKQKLAREKKQDSDLQKQGAVSLISQPQKEIVKAD